MSSAKRHGDARLATLWQAGVGLEMLVGRLAWPCGWIDVVRPITPRELLPLFRVATIPAQPFVIPVEHLKVIGYDAASQTALTDHTRPPIAGWRFDP